MSRSVHTRPDQIRAAERVRLPRAPRGTHGRRHWSRIRGLKGRGIATSPLLLPSIDDLVPSQPRITERRPGAGLLHPANSTTIRDLLGFLGERSSYGLRSIELTAGASSDGHVLRFGALVGPGAIRLYALPKPPWLLVGSLAEAEVQRLVRAGARVETAAGRLHTRVEWPGNTLVHFMLLDVLIHEIGHHIVQQYSGKRTVRVLRTRDHEAYADWFARRCRERYVRARQGMA